MRRQAMAVVVAVAAWLALAGGAHAQAKVQVLETWPAGDEVTLARNQNFYLHLSYSSDEPVQIWARPYYRGEQVATGGNPSPVYPAGSGEAFGWFFLDPGQQVDEVRIKAGNGNTRSTPFVASWRGHVAGGNAPSTAAEPDWVLRMRAAAKAEREREARSMDDAPVGVGGTLFFAGFMLAMAAVGMLGVAAPAWGIWRWQGGWRLAAAVPAAMMAFVVLRIMFGVAIDPTSHNLWPFEILQAGALSAAIMGALLLARRFSGAGRA